MAMDRIATAAPDVAKVADLNRCGKVRISGRNQKRKSLKPIALY
jgi:hypothetical protein